MAPGPVEELVLLDLERSNKGASKQRRDQINGEIGTMRDLLPLQESARQRLSQLQIMSLSCVYIRKCNILQKLLPTNRCSVEIPCEFSSALTGFILVTTRDGKLVYISENVTEYLGHSMVDMKTQGDSLFDIVDKRDHGTVQAQLLHGLATTDGQQGRKTSFFCRMNMSRTLKRQGGFGDVKVMHIKGHFVPVSSKDSGNPEQYVFMALCTPLITPDLKESLIQNNTTIFKSVHKLDMSFLEITENGEFYLNTKNSEIQNKSWYSMLHPDDLTEARSKHIQLIKSRHEMGCMMTVRMLTSTNDVIWVNIVMHVRQALVSNNDDPMIVCINQVVCEQEAKQFKIQGQLFALYAARAPDIFFGAHHMPQLHQQPDQEMMTRQHAFLQQQPGFFPAEQQHLPYPHSQMPPQSPYPHQPHQYSINEPQFEMFGQRPQGHTNTIKALKRKLQENFISSCKPSKLPRLSSSDIQGDGDFSKRDGTPYVMNVDVYRSTPSMNHMFFGNNDMKVIAGGPGMPLMYQAARVEIDPTQAIRQKRAMLVNAIAPVRRPEVVQKLAPTCTLEQVVPEVSIPDCYLTPEPSPINSPKPISYSEVVPKQESHEIKQLTSYVMGRLNEMKQSMKEDTRPQTTGPPQAKKKNLPVIDASFVDSFFDDLTPRSLKERMLDIKIEPMSPEPVMSTEEPCSVQPKTVPKCQIMDAKLPTSPAQLETMSFPIGLDRPIKEESSFDNCSDLEELFGFVDNTCKPLASPEPVALPKPSVSPKLQHCLSVAESSPVPSYASSFGSPLSLDQQKYVEMSPGSSSPGYDDRDDILDPDNWLLEPISLSLDMALPELDPLVPEVSDKDDDLFHLKQILQHPWGPCGTQASNKDTQ